MRAWLFVCAACWLFVLVVVALGTCSFTKEASKQVTKKESFSITRTEEEMGFNDWLQTPTAGLLGGLGQLGAEMGWSALSSKKQYKRAKKMYQHRYQWAVNDLKAAGLNPVLAVTSGMAASSPTAQMAAMPRANALMSAAQIGLMRAQTAKANAEADILGPRAKIMDELLEVLEPSIEWLKENVFGTSGRETQADLAKKVGEGLSNAASAAEVKLNPIIFGPAKKGKGADPRLEVNRPDVDWDVLKKQPWYKDYKKWLDKQRKEKK